MNGRSVSQSVSRKHSGRKFSSVSFTLKATVHGIVNGFGTARSLLEQKVIGTRQKKHGALSVLVYKHP
jgi:hypothetical protein